MGFVYNPYVQKGSYHLPIHDNDMMVSGFTYKEMIEGFINNVPEEKRTEDNFWQYIKGTFQQLRNELEENWEICKEGMMAQVVTKEKKRIRYYGKTVHNADTFNFLNTKVGDYVDESVADYFINVIPPATFKDDIVQLGEPTGWRFDPKINGNRPVYATIVKVAEGIWEFRGYCFRGERKENIA